MGLKMNAFGLMYNDANTSSLGKDFEVNIHTSNAGGKYHTIKCSFCGTENRISLEVIKQKLEFDAKVMRAKIEDKDYSRTREGDENLYMDNIKGSVLSFRCGNKRCNMPISTTISKKDIEIYTTKEYGEKVSSFVETANNNKQSIRGITKQEYLDARKKD